MTKTFARQILIGLTGACFAALLFFTGVEPARAGFLDSIFGNNDDVGELINAGEKADEGTLSQGPTVSNTTGFFMTDMHVRLVGPDGANIPEGQRAYFYKKYGRGAIADVTSTIPYFFQPPATTQTFVADLLDSAHIVPRAQAQGLGFSALDPILSTWKMFRNLAYLLYVIIFLVIGLMVMFKAQMGKTAVTLQSAIPNIVVSLIFVTFSYAIAGFLIDLMYVFMYLLVGMFPSADSAQIMDYNFLQLGWTIIMGDGQSTGAFKSFADAVDGFVTSAVDFSAADTGNTWYGAISGITMSLIMSVAILVGVFKLFFELLKTYVTIVLMIAFSPLLLMLGAIPGQDVFQGWLRDLFGNLLSFPTTLLIIIVFRMFTSSTAELAGSATEIVTGGFLPPFLIGRGSAGALTTLVGIGIVLIMPELIQQMKKAVGVREGIFTVLAKDAMSNFGKNFKQGSIALEGGAVVGAGAAGMGAGGLAYLRGREKKFNLRSMGRAMVHGFTPDGSDQTYGGATNWGGRVQKVAHKGRVFLDRLAEGKVGDPEDITKLIANYVTGDKDKDGKTGASTGFKRPKSGKK